MNVQLIIRQPFSVSSEQIEAFAHHKTRQTLARFTDHLYGVQMRLDRSSMREGRIDCLCSIAIELNRGKRLVLHSVGKTPFAAISEALKAGKRTLAQIRQKEKQIPRESAAKEQRHAA
ncbi:MAG: hypothetical protein HQ519_02100 [Planctomycetes bacterium]|nr:hypothetical protein [Planctomycetota bacterium]